MSAVLTPTYSEDVARGLDHPDSVAARMRRIVAANEAEQDRKSRINKALRLIRESLKSEDDVVRILNTTSSALAKQHGPESYLHPVVVALDELADSIEFPEEA